MDASDNRNRPGVRYKALARRASIEARRAPLIRARAEALREIGVLP